MMDGARVRLFREGRGEDQRAFADWLNLSLGRKYDKARISRWESGAERVPVQVAGFLVEQGAGAVKAIQRPVILTVANQKGGVGKTSSAVNFAYLFASEGYRTLFVDLDPQASATAYLGVDQKEAHAAGKTIVSVLKEDARVIDCIIPVLDGKMSMLASTIAAAGLELGLANDPVNGGALVFRRKLAEVQDHFDFIVIDTNPSLSMLTVNALNAADFVLIPVQTEQLASLGLSLLLETVGKIRQNTNPKLEVLGILPTMHTTRNVAEKLALQEIHELFGSKIRIFDPIPRTTKFTQSVMLNQPLVKADPTSPGTDVYRAIAGLVIKHATEEVRHVPA
jgi:chromosome partitioning protein